MTDLAPRPPSTFASLRHHNARLYFGGLIVSNVGSWLQLTALSWLVLTLTNDGFALGAVVAAQFLPMLLLGAWAGVVADRSNRRRMVFVTQALSAVQALVLGVLDLTGNVNVAWVFALSLVLGTINAFDNPARRSFITELVDPDELANAMSLNTAVMTGARVIGPALAGWLVEAVGTGWCFVGNAVSFIAVLVSIAVMDAARIVRTPPAPRAKGQVREGLAVVRHDPVLRVALLVVVVVSTFTFNYHVTLPLLVERVFERGAGTFGLLLAVTSVGSVIGSLLTARRHVTLGWLLSNSLLLGGAMILMALSPALWVAFALAVPMGLGGAGFVAACAALIMQRAAPTMRGRLLALQSTAFLGSTPIGSPVVGAIGEQAGARAALVFGGAVALGAAAMGSVARRGGTAYDDDR
jgi:MFS family permease